MTLVPALEVRSCDSLVVAVGHQEYRSMSVDLITELCRDPGVAVLGDLKGLYDRAECVGKGFDVFRF